MNKVDRGMLIKKILIATLFLIVMIFISVKYAPLLKDVVSQSEEFRKTILSYGYLGAFVLIAFQVVQILIPFIPGELVQIAGGYVYGGLIAPIYLLFGTLLGGVIVFYLSRFIGYPLVKIFVSKEKMEKFSFLMQSKKAEITLFILFLVPGVPKDTLIYLAGLTPVKPLRFFIILTIARIPGILGTSFIGANILEKDYKDIYLMVGIIAVVLIVGLVFRKQILEKVLEKHSGEV